MAEEASLGMLARRHGGSRETDPTRARVLAATEDIVACAGRKPRVSRLKEPLRASSGPALRRNGSSDPLLLVPPSSLPLQETFGFAGTFASAS